MRGTLYISCDSQKQNLNFIVDKLLPVSNMASSRSEENVSLKYFQHLEVSQCWCVLQFCFGHFCLECLADVIANFVKPYFVFWQMLLPFTILW